MSSIWNNEARFNFMTPVYLLRLTKVAFMIAAARFKKMLQFSISDFSYSIAVEYKLLNFLRIVGDK